MRKVVIIPTYNERENIERVISEVLKQKIKDLRVLVVDDSSPDKTYEAVKTLMKTEKRLYLLLNKEKKGLGHAYMKGMEHAIRQMGADAVVEMDADLSHNPDKLPHMIEKLKRYDIVLGSRYTKGGSIPKDWGVHRKFLSYFGNLAIRVMLLNPRIRDWSTGYRAIRKEVYIAVKDEMQEFSGYTFQIAFLHKALDRGFCAYEIPIYFRDREKGSSKLGFEYIANCFSYIMDYHIRNIFKKQPDTKAHGKAQAKT